MITLICLWGDTCLHVKTTKAQRPIVQTMVGCSQICSCLGQVHYNTFDWLVKRGILQWTVKGGVLSLMTDIYDMFKCNMRRALWFFIWWWFRLDFRRPRLIMNKVDVKCIITKNLVGDLLSVKHAQRRLFYIITTSFSDIFLNVKLASYLKDENYLQRYGLFYHWVVLLCRVRHTN